MKSVKKGLMFLVSLLMVSGSLFSQTPETMIINGILSDMDSDPISRQNCDVLLSFVSSNEKLLYSVERKISTNEKGEFTLILGEIPDMFSSTDDKELVDMIMEMKGESGSTWLPEGKFSVKYHIEKTSTMEFKITRFEGQQMNQSSSSPVWMFHDLYPLAYLKNTFMISFSEELSDPEAIIQICRDMSPPEADSPAKERGIKGGYAVGGYKTKK